MAGGCEADRLTWEGDHAGAVAIAERAQTHLDHVAGEGMYGGLWLSAVALSALADEAAYCRQKRDEAGAAAAESQGEVLRQRVERIIEGGHGRPGDLGPEGACVARACRGRACPPARRAGRRPVAAGPGRVRLRTRLRASPVPLAVGRGLGRIGRPRVGPAACQRRGGLGGQMGAVPLQRAVAATMSGPGSPARPPRLTRSVTGREQEVLALVAEGMTNREIGKRLFISEKTASVHLSNLMAKLNVSSRTEAVTVAQRRGLLDVM